MLSRAYIVVVPTWVLERKHIRLGDNGLFVMPDSSFQCLCDSVQFFIALMHVLLLELPSFSV